MALALRLNELATANAQGLLNDDEYRLLRQDVFERYSKDAILPVETPIVSLSSTRSATSISQALSSPRKKQVEFAPSDPPRPPSPSPLSRPKASVTSGVASFIRRATGRKPSPKDNPAPVLDTPTVTTTISLKRALTPHLSRKPSLDMTSIHSASSSTHPDSGSISSFSRKSSSGTLSPPMSPSRSTSSREKMMSASSSKISLSTASRLPDDIFEDGGLSTTKEIRQAILDLEKEGKRLVDAFNELEQSAIAKRQRRSPHGPPTSATTLPSWPESAPPMITRRVRSDSTFEPRSTLSPTTTRTSSPRKASSSRNLLTTPSLRRKNSNSSIASQTTSLLSVSRAGSIKKSRSTGHLPLSMLAEDESSPGREASVADDGAEVADVRRRKLEVIGRYEARLEYLRARLKGAELHERLLKK